MYNMAAIGAALAASILFSLKGILVKSGMAHGALALDMLALRMLLAAPCYALLLAWSLRRRPQSMYSLLPAVGLGLLGNYLSPTLNFHGLQTVSASLERILIHAIPAMVILVGWVVDQKKPRRLALAGLLVCYGGIVLSCLGRDHGRLGVDFAGVVSILSGCLTYAFFLLRSAQGQAVLGTVTFTSVAMLSSSLACLFQNAVQGNMGPLLRLPMVVWGLGLALALLCTVVPAYMSAYGVRMLGAQRSAVYGMAGPLCVPLVAALALGERMSLPQWGGFALVMLGGGVLTRARS